jgi:hypothetical protein
MPEEKAGMPKKGSFADREDPESSRSDVTGDALWIPGGVCDAQASAGLLPVADMGKVLV